MNLRFVIHAGLMAFWLLFPAEQAAAFDDSEPEITELDRTHWAFEPLRVSEVPAVDTIPVQATGTGQLWVRNEIDHFVLARLNRLGRTPAPQASKETLLRRASFVLVGLPPTPDEIAAFVGDQSPDAWANVVDRLLSSPHYGERWAQHWLDLARFAESDGFEHDLVRPNAWRYRDWVIQALNQDLPYREFVRSQLAGDLAGADATSDAILATGFLLCGPDMPDLNLAEERRHNVLNEMTATTGAVFLGLQMGCAQCHHHKFDPVSLQDFYRMRSFFESTEWLKEQPLRLSGPATPSELLARVVTEGTARKSYVRPRGDFRRTGAQVGPAFPRIAVLTTDESSFENRAAQPTRLDLADWIASPRNPLAMRVIVNRVWMHHFGEGIVATPSDFGSMGSSPLNRDLLDWLAAEFPRRGGRLKDLHRLILLSAAWQQSVCDLSGQPTAGDVHRRRLDGEAIRDSLLLVSGTLNREMGGPGVRPPLPGEVVSTLLKNQWEVTPDATQHTRRSIYLFVRRNLRFPIFDVFDRPDTNASCAQRRESTTAPQALALLNSELTQTAADDLAVRLTSEQSLSDGSIDSVVVIEQLWLTCLGRHPRPEETSLCSSFLTSQTEILKHNGHPPATASQLALRDLCLSVMNSNEFIYVD